MIGNKFCQISIVLGIALTFGAMPTFGNDYRLGTTDKLRIKVQEWPDLAGEYTVTPDGVVSFPLIGNINVVGLSPNDLAREISDRLQRRSEGAERAFAAVEIVQYRPFAILGDVQKPGQYPYRPGLTVLDAISVAAAQRACRIPGQQKLDSQPLRVFFDHADARSYRAIAQFI